ncbi:unnamed protein product [Ranitomeya imitator]|uniref:Fucolectin tachylectin-4 pentraxin-1 domain-containing protein n=1 Tax=Ranitomeya imitator TaxID=111125 RepID=A0ABN9LNJ0_9NEOB|nr:unnamed protein product [Ranitomeya imitator]
MVTVPTVPVTGATKGPPVRIILIHKHPSNISGVFLIQWQLNAIDGNQDSDFSHGSCSHTDGDFSPWWRVDLLRSYRINRITITNRKYCCEERLNGAEILVGDSLYNNGNNNPRCAVVTTIPRGATQVFLCHDMVGRYVNVIVRGRNEYLHMCEVQVFGDL